MTLESGTEPAAEPGTDTGTDRLILRRWRESDADFMFDLYSRWEVKRFIGRVPRVMADRAEAATRIAWLPLQDHPVQGLWAVALRDTGELVGNILLKPIPASGTDEPLLPSGDIEIGWHFHPDHWGNGYATEAAGEVLRRASLAGLHRVVAVTAPQNVASQAVCRRIGLMHAGQTTKYYNATCELFVGTP
ncbi:MAG: GNAT family N-acetyltransferase [Burkholderiaceae bacterium]|nr:GNAT family N-acetyltransferase [Microbacteriaceae bacterium]